MEKAIEIAVNYGIFGVLFVSLLWYILKQNQSREEKYLKIIEHLTEKFEGIELAVREIQGDVKEIRRCNAIRQKIACHPVIMDE